MEKRRIYFKEWRKHRELTQKQVVDRLSMHDDELLPKTEASLSRLENRTSSALICNHRRSTPARFGGLFCVRVTPPHSIGLGMGEE